MPTEGKQRARHRGRAWAEEAKSNESALRVRLSAIRQRGPEDIMSQPEFIAVCDGVSTLLDKSRSAAEGNSPKHRIFVSWWNGTCIEAAFKNLHKAEAEMARLYSKFEVPVEIPEAVARAEWALRNDDPRRIAALRLLKWMHSDECQNREHLSKIIQVGHEAADRQRSNLRTYRNVVLLGGAIGLLLGFAFVIIISLNPNAIPLCFQPLENKWVCPTGGEGPTGGDIGAIALLGLFGGLVSGAVFMNGLKANSAPYNVSVPLAILKIPAGALTSVAGILILAGDFIPGFSALDTQAQILAYAFSFGFAQQLLTRLLDQRAQSLASTIPSKDSMSERGSANDPLGQFGVGGQKQGSPPPGTTVGDK